MLVASALSLRAGGEYMRALRDIARKLGPIRATRNRIQASRRVSDRDALCADDLDLPRGSSPLGIVVKLMNIGFRAYWRLVGSLL